MYGIFGNFDSVEELNACAEGLKASGDGEKLRELAKENGIPEVFAEDYLNGASEEFTDWMNAAIGKLEAEAARLQREKESLAEVKKGVMHVPDLTCFHWGRDYFLEEGEGK